MEEKASSNSREPRVCLVHAHPKVAEIAARTLEASGFLVHFFHLRDFPANLRGELERFVNESRPDLIIFEVSHPFHENWGEFRRLLERTGRQHCPFLLTTVEKSALTSIAGAVPYVQIRGIPFNPDALVDAAITVLEAGGKPPLRHRFFNREASLPNDNVAA